AGKKSPLLHFIRFAPRLRYRFCLSLFRYRMNGRRMHHGKTSSPPQATVPAAVTATPETTDLLLEAFNLFTKASDSLQAAYSQLPQRTESLSLELEATNRKLLQNLEEKERVRNYLNTILESLPCGVLVVDGLGAMTICTPLAARLLSIPAERAESLPRPYRDL